ncbi:hypothetical protein AAG906_012398 [Vitis piasezkii]
MTSAEELDNQKAPPDHINDISHGSGDALSKDNDVDGEEHNDLSKEGQMNDKVLEGNLFDSGAEDGLSCAADVWKEQFCEEKDDLLESGNQLNSEISTSHLDTSLLSEVTNKLSEVSRQSGIHNFDSDVPVVEDGNVKLSTDLSNMEHEIGGSLPIRECSRENNDIVLALD